MKRRVLLAAGLGLLGGEAARAADGPWPSMPLRLVVPFPPGGTSDAMGRMLEQPLTAALGQPVRVENLSGEGGAAGTLKALSSPADGYTLIQTGVGQNAVAHGLNPALGYDSNADFIHLTQVHSGPNVLLVNPREPFATFQDWLAYGKANPGKLRYGYTHAASGHMAMELLKQSLSVCVANSKGGRNCSGLNIVGVVYRGGGPLLADLLAGRIPMAFINQDAAYPHVKSGALRALAVTSVRRNPLYPTIPTVDEVGIPGFQALSWSGISVAKGTPKPIADRLEAELTKIMKSPAIAARFAANGFIVPDQGSYAYSEFVRRESSRWSRVIKIAGIRPE